VTENLFSSALQMMVLADKVVGNITLHFCLLQLRYCDENWAVMGGYGCHGQTHGVRTWVVGCPLASLLGVEYEQYYIQKRLDIMLKNSILYSILRTRNTPIICSHAPPKMGYLRCDSRGIYLTGNY
jgi:hypothetical protein